MEMGKAAHSLRLTGAFDRGGRVGGLLGRKKRGSWWAAPFMNGMKVLNMMFISIFPGNFFRVLSLHCSNRSFFRICCMYFDLTFQLLLLMGAPS
jgi:hypothetical protein